MIITEKDIFGYVFNPEILDKETKDYIDQNTEKYVSQIEILKTMKENETTILPNEAEKVKLTSKIGNNNPIILFPIEDLSSNTLSLAAANGNTDSEQPQMQMFKDEAETLIIKAMHTKEITKLFVIPKNPAQFTDIKIILHPSEEKIHFKDFTYPAVIERTENIHQIELI